MKALGFPGRSRVRHRSYNDLPMQVFPVETRVKFVTVSHLHGH